MTRKKQHKAHARLGPSSAARWLACPPSVAASEDIRKASSVAAEEGTFAHAVLEACLLLHYSADDVLEYDMHEGQEVPEDMRHCIARAIIYVHRWEAAHPGGRVFMEHRTDPGKLIGRDDMYGTSDIVLVDVGANVLESVDYKHGRKRVGATDNPQTKLYALGALADFIPKGLWRKTRVKTVIIQPRSGDFDDCWDTTGAALLDWLEGTVQPAALLTTDKNGPRQAGDHCFFCPASGGCREQAVRVFQTAAMEFASEEEQAPQDVTEMSAGEVAYALAFAPFIESWLSALQYTAQRMLLDGETLEGQSLVYKRKHRTWESEEKVMAWAKKYHLDSDTFTPRHPLAIGAMFKQLKKHKLADKVTEDLNGLVQQPTPEITVAPEGDGRQVVEKKDYGKFKEN